MAKAIDQWNGKTGTTKISFSLVSSDPDVKINLDIQKSNCGDYRPTDGRPQFLDVSSYLVGALTPSPNPGGEPSAAQVEARIDKAAYPLAHELGHTMNLGESSDSSSIMSVPSYVQCNGAALDNFPARTVSEGDADRAVNCWKSVVRNDFAFDGDGSADHTETRYDCECSCWTQYQVIVGYQYADAPGGYVAVELQRWEIDSGCGEPPDM